MSKRLLAMTPGDVHRKVASVRVDRTLRPNAKVMLELGYALAIGICRTRIVCVVDDAHFPYGNP